MSNSSIWPLHWTLFGAIILGQSGPGSNGNESSNIIKASLLDCLVSYLRHLLWESYPLAEMQLVYSTAPADLALFYKDNFGIELPSKVDMPLNKETKPYGF